MSQPIRFLISGPGLIGKQHAKLVQARPDAELVAVIAPAVDEHRQFAREHRVPLYHDISTALSNDRIDAAIISSPNPVHFEQAVACIDNRVPVLVEKPVTDRIEDARQLVDQADVLGVPVLVGHHRTYSPLLDAAQAFLVSPEFGRLVVFQGAALFYKPKHYFEEGAWRTKLGGGPILINLIHEIGLMRHLCGEIKSLCAIASNAVRQFEVEDTVAISLEFENGALGSFLLSDTAASSKSWEMTSCENPSYPAFPDDNCYHFAGTNGSLDFPSMRMRYYGESSEPSWWNPFDTQRLVVTRANPLERQLDHFVQVVRGREPPRVSARDGYRNMLVVEAIRRSMATRAAVDMSPA